MKKINWKWVGYGYNELKFIKSIEDVRLLCTQKLPFLYPRLLGSNYQELSVPPSLQLEPTNICNLRCISCPRDNMTREKGSMDLGLFKKIITEASEIGVKRVHLYLHGEPAIHPNLVEMIKFIKANKMGLNLTTNGSVFDDSKIRDILEAGINSSDYITFSILGASKEVHENVMKGVNHEKVVNNVLLMLDLRKKLKINGPVIETVFYTLPENEKDRNAFFEFWAKRIDHAKIVGKVSKSFADYGNQEELAKIPIRHRTCKNIWERMTIYWNGDVVMCCEDVGGVTKAGNLNRQSIKDIWNSKKLKRFREFHKNGKVDRIPLCASCDE